MIALRSEGVLPGGIPLLFHGAFLESKTRVKIPVWKDQLFYLYVLSGISSNPSRLLKLCKKSGVLVVEPYHVKALFRELITQYFIKRII
jgi:hypothetical protein